MKKRDIRFASIPSTEEVAAERERLAYQSRYQRVLRKTLPVEVRELLQMQSKRLGVHMEKLSWVRHNWNLE